MRTPAETYGDPVSGSPFKNSALGLTVIPCCVPYWDQQAFFRAGGQFTEGCGYHVAMDAYLDPLDEWLPRKWQYRGDPPLPALLPDLLPSTTWENNLRSRFTDSEWDRLRKFCYQAAGYACVACGSRGAPHLECHEAWKFDEASGRQILRGLLCLCPLCHKAKHLGFANRIGVLRSVYARLRWLNNWTQHQLEEHLEQSMARQEELSKRTWELDVSFLTGYGVR